VDENSNAALVRPGGKCVAHLVRNALHPYPVRRDIRVEGDEIQVDVAPIKPARSQA
jgi:toluene monooxygenase system ferredoxin subunit